MAIRIDANLKRDFETFCKSVGMTANSAVNLLMRRTVEMQRIPFEVTVNTIVQDSAEGQTLRSALRVNGQLKKEFQATCKTIGIKMSRLIKMFMLSCISNGKLPF